MALVVFPEKKIHKIIYIRIDFTQASISNTNGTSRAPKRFQLIPTLFNALMLINNRGNCLT